MKIFKVIFSTALVLSFATNALAVKRAPFPNTNTLQPIPRNVLPNITSNVNSDTVQTEQLPSEPIIQDEIAMNTEQGTASSGGGGASVVYTVIGIALVSGLYLRFRIKR
jgi:hypothetical protein